MEETGAKGDYIWVKRDGQKGDPAIEQPGRDVEKKEKKKLGKGVKFEKRGKLDLLKQKKKMAFSP